MTTVHGVAAGVLSALCATCGSSTPSPAPTLPVGPYLVRDINAGPGDSGPAELVELGDVILFSARDGEVPDGPGHGIELWKSDGSAEGTVMVKDIVPGSRSGFPFEFAPLAGRLLFGVLHDESGNERLLITDGTAVGTHRVRDGLSVSTVQLGRLFQVVQGKAYFGGSEQGREPYQLWRTDGTSEGTERVSDPPISGGPSNPVALTPAGHKLYFMAETDREGEELWVSDGTPEGTRLTRDVFPGPTSSMPFKMGVVGERVFFAADDGIHGRELWVSDGTLQGTSLVLDANPGPQGSYFWRIVGIGSRAFIAMGPGNLPTTLWVSDGTAEGTRSLNVGAGYEMEDLNGTLIFSRSDGLWRSDGTPEGTRLLKALPYGDRRITRATADVVLVQIGDRELWVSDGTVEGTVKATEAPSSGSIFEPAYANGRIFMRLCEPTYGCELWAQRFTLPRH